jgi:hypothetical protein
MNWYSTALERAASLPDGLAAILATSLAFAALAVVIPYLGLPFSRTASQRLYWYHTISYLLLVGGTVVALAREPEPLAMHRGSQPFTQLVLAGETGFLLVATGIMALRRTWIPSLLLHHILFAAIIGWCLVTGQAIMFLAWALLVQATGFIYYPMCILRGSSEVDRRLVEWLAVADAVAVFVVRVLGFTAVTMLLAWQYVFGTRATATWSLCVIGVGAFVLVVLNLYWFVGARRRSSASASIARLGQKLIDRGVVEVSQAVLHGHGVDLLGRVRERQGHALLEARGRGQLQILAHPLQREVRAHVAGLDPRPLGGQERRRHRAAE